MPGARHREPEGRQRIHGADPAHHLRARADRRLRHPLRHRRAVRWRLRPRLQPHEFPLGQCRHVPDLARLAHVAGGQQVLQGRRAGPDHHVLRRAAGLHAARRRRLRLRDPADGLRRDRHRRRGAGLADPPGQGAHRRRHGAGRLPSSCSKATSIRATAASRPRNRRTPASRAAIHFHPEWAGYMGKAYKAPTFHVTGGHDAQAQDQADHLRARRAHARRPQHRHHGARGGDLRAVQPAAARHRAGRGDPLLHDRLGRLHHPGQEAPPDRRRLAAQFPGARRCPARRACGSRSR